MSQPPLTPRNHLSQRQHLLWAGPWPPSRVGYTGLQSERLRARGRLLTVSLLCPPLPSRGAPCLSFPACKEGSSDCGVRAHEAGRALRVCCGWSREVMDDGSQLVGRCGGSGCKLPKYQPEPGVGLRLLSGGPCPASGPPHSGAGWSPSSDHRPSQSEL